MRHAPDFAASLRAVLRYEIPTTTDDAFGDPTETTTTTLEFRGSVRSPNGRELLAAQAIRAVVSRVIESRFPGYPFDPRGRIVDLTDPDHVRTYQIVSSVDPDGRRERLVTYAVEASPGPES